jgi:hypothetical protein
MLICVLDLVAAFATSGVGPNQHYDFALESFKHSRALILRLRIVLGPESTW